MHGRRRVMRPLLSHAVARVRARTTAHTGVPPHVSLRWFSTAAPPSTATLNGVAGAPRAVLVKTAAQFSGTHLDEAWTRQFVLGSLLQRYDPLRYAPSSASLNARRVESALLESQRALSALWKLPVRPLEALSEARILRLLARYAAGEGTLSDASLITLQHVLERLPGAPTCVADPVQMRTLLERIGYVESGDNIHRVAYAGELHYPPQAHAFMTEWLDEDRQRDGGDAFDAIREHRPGPGYAIDSASTSEVDDAIGVCVDASTEARYFVVYVSDATVYCPFDSALEQVTARRLTTTTYLPEGVFFMLPKPIVEAATLREDRPCRTFNIIFAIDEATGEVKDYSIAVGWLQQLRRITYDQVQAMIDTDADAAVAGLATATKELSPPGKLAAAPAAAAPPLAAPPLAAAEAHPPPSWMTSADRDNLFYILHCARIRLKARLERQARERHRAAADASSAGAVAGGDVKDAHEGAPSTSLAPPTDFSLPDPLIKVKGTTVVSLTDQVISTQDARLAVAELMIAANEVCSRVAQANQLTLPFRGTRARSSDHLVAQYYAEPQGVGTLDSLDATHTFLAEAMQASVRRLSTVTRAIYHHVPLYHAGLDTTFYAHSTSPLRRYADMLVHHQLKTWLWQQRHPCGRHLGAASAAATVPQQPIPEYAMASLCAMISTKQERASLLQDSSTRFWVLRYLEDIERGVGGGATQRGRTFVCLVGETRRVVAAPTYSRFVCTAAAVSRMLGQPLPTSTAAGQGHEPSRQRRAATLQLDSAHARWQQTQPDFTYVSDVYLPEVQLAHTIAHHRNDVRVGAVVECRIARVQPAQGVLELEICRVLSGGDERDYERLWMGGLVSQLDA